MREFVEVTKAAGKVIEGVSDPCFDAAILITFTDGTFSAVRAIRSYEDAEIVTGKIDVIDLPRAASIKLGVATEHEFQEHEAARANQWLERTQKYEREEYLRLKAKFEGGK